MSAPTYFVWGVLLALAPIVAAYVAHTNGSGIWTTAAAAAVAGSLVVALFAAIVGRRL